VLTGVLGYGEHRQPWHPHAIAFARLLLESGADPNDGQTLYNRMFGTSDDHLVLLFEYGLGRDSRGPWHRLLGESLESPAEMLRALLAWAIAHDQRERVALLAEHGVDIVSPFTEQRSPRRRTPIEVALISGHRELADQLAALGARPPRLSAADTFVAAVLAGDADAAAHATPAVVAAVRRKRTGLVTWAAAQGAANSVELLVSAGFDVNALGRSDIASNDPWHTALHVAAEKGDLVLARTLLELGADPEIPDKHYRSTPLGWARYFGQPALAALLGPVTRS
jgi:ankyrin repeat protein